MTPVPSFYCVSRPSPHDGAGTPDSEFGGWGAAGVPVSALARVLAARATPLSPSSGGNPVHNRSVMQRNRACSTHCLFFTHLYCQKVDHHG